MCCEALKGEKAVRNVYELELDANQHLSRIQQRLRGLRGKLKKRTFKFTLTSKI
tara:strand:+ start:215 stop:376 length:162 start_codon:yes stop_codon:yes gene_type:complete